MTWNFTVSLKESGFHSIFARYFFTLKTILYKEWSVNYGLYKMRPSNIQQKKYTMHNMDLRHFIQLNLWTLACITKSLCRSSIVDQNVSQLHWIFVCRRLTIFFFLKFTNLNCIAENSSPEHKYYTGIAREVFNVASDSNTLGWPTRHFFFKIFWDSPLASSISWAPVAILKTKKANS